MKKSLILMSAFGVFLAGQTFAAPATTEALTDAKGTPASQAVEFLKNQNIIEGYQDGTFKPEKEINRAEFLKIVLKSNDLLEKNCKYKNKAYSDVKNSDWFSDVICSASNKNIVEGYPDGTFKPANTINFAEASKIIAKVNKLELDENAQGEWFEKFVNALEEEKVVPESVKGIDKEISRGEMAQIIWGVKTGNEVENKKEGELKKINSCRNLNAQIKKFQKRQNKSSSKNNYRRDFQGGFENKVIMNEAFAEDLAVPQVMQKRASFGNTKTKATSSIETESVSDKEYSTTNIQEFGVDEADIIKNDGQYIYLIKNNSIRIIDAENLTQVTKFEFGKDQNYKGFNPREMYIDGNILTVIGNRFQNNYEKPSPVKPPVEIFSFFKNMIPTAHALRIAPGYGGGYYGNRKNFTELIAFDLSDIKHPKEIRKVSVEGNYSSSRKIGNVVYLVSQKYNNYWGRPIPMYRNIDMPMLEDSANLSEKFVGGCEDVHYFPNFTDTSYLVISAIDTKNTNNKIGRKVLLGSGGQIYASQKNLFVTRQKNKEVFLDTPTWTGWQYHPITEIFKFSLNGNKVEFEAKGEVTGSVLNQYSMSEGAGQYFRIATQDGRQNGSIMNILDKDLKPAGKIKNIAPGENIKSVRFMGNRGYMVTFKQVDPLFVIDLTPNNPKILGKLKIPGWSDYLHPYDENHLIGIGKEADESIDADKVHSDNAIYYTAVQGLKLSMFDVTDLKNPKELFKKVIGDRGTYSEVLNNPKALLFDKDKKILALPITVMAEDKKSLNGYTQTRQVFNGAFVYDIDLNEGFKLRGKASHYPKNYWNPENKNERRYGSYEFNIQRILYIGKKFFTVSPNVVESHTWENVEEIGRLVLDQKPCNQIYNELECSESTQCKTVFKEWKECSVDNEDFSKICKDQKQYLRCDSK